MQFGPRDILKFTGTENPHNPNQSASKPNGHGEDRAESCFVTAAAPEVTMEARACSKRC